MEKILDLEGLPEDRIQYLKNLIAIWRGPNQNAQATDAPKPIVKRRVSPDEFIVKNSKIIGGEFTRAMAYED